MRQQYIKPYFLAFISIFSIIILEGSGCLFQKKKINYGKGLLYVAEGRADSLKIFLKNYSASDIQSDSILSYFEAYTLLSEYRYDEAHVAIDNSISFGKDVNNLNLKGMIYMVQQDTVNAILAFQEALEIFHDFPNTLNYLGILYTGTQKYDEAETVFRKALLIDSNNPEYNSNMAINFIQREMYDSGLCYINIALKYAPVSHSFNFVKGYSLLKQSSKNDSALYYLNRAIELAPTIPKYYYYRGLYYSQNYNQIQACEDLDKCLFLGGFGNAAENKAKYCP